RTSPVATAASSWRSLHGCPFGPMCARSRSRTRTRPSRRSDRVRWRDRPCSRSAADDVPQRGNASDDAQALASRVVRLIARAPTIALRDVQLEVPNGEPSRELDGRERPGDVVALGLVAPELRAAVERREGLGPLRDDTQPPGPAE